MKPKTALTQLEDLMVHAEGYANFLMRKNGRMAPTVLASTPKGGLCYVPKDLSDTRAKDNFANTARLISAAYAAEAVVMVVEGWVTMAKPGEVRRLAAYWCDTERRRDSRLRFRLLHGGKSPRVIERIGAVVIPHK